MWSVLADDQEGNVVVRADVHHPAKLYGSMSIIRHDMDYLCHHLAYTFRKYCFRLAILTCANNEFMNVGRGWKVLIHPSILYWYLIRNIFTDLRYSLNGLK